MGEIPPGFVNDTECCLCSDNFIDMGAHQLSLVLTIIPVLSPTFSSVRQQSDRPSLHVHVAFTAQPQLPSGGEAVEHFVPRRLGSDFPDLALVSPPDSKCNDPSLVQRFSLAPASGLAASTFYTLVPREDGRSPTDAESFEIREHGSGATPSSPHVKLPTMH